MKKTLVLALSMFLVVGFVAVADLAGAADYDRYERGTAPPPPPPRYRSEPPQMRHAVRGEMYVFGHAGIFDPNDDSWWDDGLERYDSGYNFDVGFGSRVTRIFAVEGAVGAYGADDGSNEARVIPVTIGGRLIIPTPFIEPYFGFGLGLYATKLKESPGTRYSADPGVDDRSTDVGGYLSFGADFWLNQQMALNFEGKYHGVTSTFRDNAGGDFDVNMGGWTANLGLRFSF
ncbi:MAG: outer membrane beta-barrel protein [Actinomycetota bacterium]